VARRHPPYGAGAVPRVAALSPEDPTGSRNGDDGQEAPPRLFRIDRKMVLLLLAGGIAALLIFWLEPSFTLRYVVVGVLGASYVFLRFNDWR